MNPAYVPRDPSPVPYSPLTRVEVAERRELSDSILARHWRNGWLSDPTWWKYVADNLQTNLDLTAAFTARFHPTAR